jgi:hypothetical protein
MVPQKLIVDDQGDFKVAFKAQTSHQVVKFFPA